MFSDLKAYIAPLPRKQNPKSFNYCRYCLTMIEPGYDLKSNILLTALLFVPRNNKTQKVLIIADIEILLRKYVEPREDLGSSPAQDDISEAFISWPSLTSSSSFWQILSGTTKAC
jgi:hypothetical protein